MKLTFAFVRMVGVLLIMALGLSSAHARYGERFCSDPRFDCIRVQAGETWASLWPNTKERDIIKRLNRINIPLYPGQKIAVPKDLDQLSALDVSPFRAYITPPGKKTIIVDQKRLAWGAYTPNGELIYWGPMSGGQNWCGDVNRGCRTASGKFVVYNKGGAGCKSTKFPLGKGGAPMPYCMFFHGGFALHGAAVVPGYHASHGCVRLFTEDAAWLHSNFVTLPNKGPTQVIVEPL